MRKKRKTKLKLKKHSVHWGSKEQSRPVLSTVTDAAKIANPLRATRYFVGFQDVAKIQSQKKLGSRVALVRRKFLQIQKVFATCSLSAEKLPFI